VDVNGILFSVFQAVKVFSKGASAGISRIRAGAAGTVPSTNTTGTNVSTVG
jgi:hypothetical protein